MKRLSRLKHFGVLAGLLMAAALPAYAARVLGTADTLAVLAGDQIVANAGATTVAGKAGQVNGTAGAGSFTSSTTATAPEVTAALTDLTAARTTLTARGGSAVAADLSGATFTPGVYSIPGNATLNGTLTLNGTGEYVFNIGGSLTTTAGSTVSLINGANAANVYFNVGTTASLGDNTALNGILLAGGDITLGAVPVGPVTTVKLLSRNGDVVFNGGTFGDPVAGPAAAFNVASAAPVSNGCFVVNVGQTVTATITATATGANNAELSVTGVPANLTFAPNAGGVDAGGANGGDLLATGAPASTTASFTPAAGQAGQTFALTFLGRDATTGIIGTQAVCFTVASTAPAFNAPTPASGTIFQVDPGSTVSFTITASDPDPGDTVSLGVTGAPGTATFTPALPASGNPASTTFSFTPTGAQVGSQFDLTLTATSGDGAAAPRTVTIQVIAPVVTTVTITRTQPKGTPAAGELICYLIRVEDQFGNPVADEPVTLTVFDDTVNPTGNGSGSVFSGTTDENGEAEICFTRSFPGDIVVEGAAGNVISSSDFVTVEAAASTANGEVNGSGLVDASELGETKLGGAAAGLFSINLKTSQRGRPSGGMRFVVTGLKDFRGGRFEVVLRRIESLTIEDTGEGRLATIVGTARATGFGTVPVLIETLDAATPGVPADVFLITLLLEDGKGPITLTLGGNLLAERYPSARLRNDVRVKRIGGFSRRPVFK